MKNKSNEKGITLIALVITVIVLLILAGAAVSIGLNGGDLFSKANDAKTGWNTKVNAQDEELSNLMNMLNTVAGNTPTPSADGLVIPKDLTVGDTITWTPSGHYEWNKDYYSVEDSWGSGRVNETKMLYSGTEVPTGAVTEWSTSSNNVDMTISSWKVLRIDTSNNNVTLVPSSPTQAGVHLEMAQGYNNGVKLLNDACSALYGNGNGVTARSINMVDLEGTAGDGSNGLMSADITKIASAKAETGMPSYGEKHTTGYEEYGTVYRSDEGAYLEYPLYPVIYEEEALREINNEYSATGLGMSDAKSEFITRANDGIFLKRDATSIRPTQTFYKLDYVDFPAALGETNAGLMLPSGPETPWYWVASRCVNLKNAESWCNFGLRCIMDGELNAKELFSSEEEYSTSDTMSLFPIVTISAGTLTRFKSFIRIYSKHIE